MLLDLTRSILLGTLFYKNTAHTCLLLDTRSLVSPSPSCAHKSLRAPLEQS